MKLIFLYFSTFFFSALLNSYIFIPALAATKPKPKTSNKTIKSSLKTEKHNGWSQWYIQTIKDKPFAAMREDADYRASRKEWSINQKWWEKDIGSRINNVIIGSVTQDDFTPQAFNVEKKAGKNWARADGRLRKGLLRIRAEQSGGKTPFEKQMVTQPGTTLGVFAAVYTMKVWQQNREKAEAQDNPALKTAPFFFLVLLEEPENNSYNPTAINITPLNRFQKILKRPCYEFNVEYLSEKMQWFIDEDGRLCKMLNPGREIELKAVRSAKGYLGEVP